MLCFYADDHGKNTLINSLEGNNPHFLLVFFHADLNGKNSKIRGRPIRT